MTDASPSGGGVIKATATREEVVKEASIATKSGWTEKREERARARAGFWDGGHAGPRPAATHSKHRRARGLRRLQATDPKTFKLFKDTRETVRKTRVPPLGELWRSKGRFQERFRTTWSWTEPSNIVEARTIALAVQGLARSTKNWGKRLLLATDNLAALGALGAGHPGPVC